MVYTLAPTGHPADACGLDVSLKGYALAKVENLLAYQPILAQLKALIGEGSVVFVVELPLTIVLGVSLGRDLLYL